MVGLSDDDAAIRWYIRGYERRDSSVQASSFRALLRDARGATGRDLETGQVIPEDAARSAPCEKVMSDFCPAANLFCSREHVADWRQRAGSPEGAALPLTKIAEHGRRAWANVAPSTHQLEDR
jgi:Alkylmercury lyase